MGVRPCRLLPTLSIISILAASGATAETGAISLSQSVDRFSIPFEDSLRFEIQLQWPGAQTRYLFPQPLAPQFDRLKVRGFTSSVSTSGSGDDETTTKRFSYTLVPTSSGTATIAPVTVNFLVWPDSIPGELVTEAMTVRIAEPLPPQEESGFALAWLLAFVPLFVIAFILVRRVRYRAQEQAQTDKTDAGIVLERLARVKEEAGGDFKKFQSGVYDTLATFIRIRFGIDASHLSDDKITEALSETDLASGLQSRIAAWLTRARHDKFRPVSGTPADITRLESEIKREFESLI